ncbi:MAG: N-6 DNA methylase [Limnoraphis sp. WC205]|jgi:type I restriction enzyme M protein|nr:N-6 DNA methylase [Limnoraphis sp. WC205]
MKNKSLKKFNNQQSFNIAIKNICDIMRRSNCAGALQYIPQITWIIFLRILDEKELYEEEKAQFLGKKYRPSLIFPYRWQDWASPTGVKRIELQMSSIGGFFDFVNNQLIPHLKAFKNKPDSTPRQRVISQILSGCDRVNIDTEYNFLEILDKVHEIKLQNIESTHIFPLSQVYEGLLLKMGEKSNDGGQFFTPREIIRLMVRVIAPKLGETVYDPCCGTGGFLAQSYEFILESINQDVSSELILYLKNKTFYGREKENLIYPIALANLLLHGIDEPHIWHGNTLDNQTVYDGLFQDHPSNFDVILTNPPFGGKENKIVQTNFAFKTSSTQILFLQHIINTLKTGGRCGIVLDEGILFRTNEIAFVQTKQKLLNECDLWCIISLPVGVFANAGTSLKTNLLFFTKGKPTEEIWYYDLSDLKVSKKQPLTLDRFDDFFYLLSKRSKSPRSWTVSRQLIEEKNYDIKAVNPNSIANKNSRTRQEIISLIQAKNQEITEAMAVLNQFNL